MLISVYVLRKYIRYRPRPKFLFYSQAIVVEAERRKGGGGVNPQCLCQRPPSALSQAIHAKVERRKGKSATTDLEENETKDCWLLGT
jgi:hypothetical protein